MKPLGIIVSSGGSALRAADQCLRASGVHQSWVVIADRPCAALSWARHSGHQAIQIGYSTATQFSSDALAVFREQDVEDVLLFFSRRLAAPLIVELSVCNIHPSLLPLHPGMGAVKAAYAAGCSEIGATLHEVDEGLDTGPIIAQVSASILGHESLEQAQHLSYLEKVLLTLQWQSGQRGPGATHKVERLAMDAFWGLCPCTSAIKGHVGCGL